MKELKQILHLVQLKTDILYNYRYAEDKPEILYANIKRQYGDYRFKGYLENVSCDGLYFKVEKDKNIQDLIIIPHAWVKWCIPIDEED